MGEWAEGWNVGFMKGWNGALAAVRSGTYEVRPIHPGGCGCTDCVSETNRAAIARERAEPPITERVRRGFQFVTPEHALDMCTPENHCGAAHEWDDHA